MIGIGLILAGFVATLGWLFIFNHRQLRARAAGRLVPTTFASVFVIVFITAAGYTFFAMAWLDQEGSYNHRQMQARTYLREIATAQKQYFADHREYAGGAHAFTSLAWEPMGQNRYAFFCGSDVIPDYQGIFPCDELRRSWPFSVAPGSYSTGFTCISVGNIDQDPDYDVWAINDAVNLNLVANDWSREEHYMRLDSRPMKIWIWVMLGLEAALAVVIARDEARWRRARRKATP